ncbi:hypothetical protein DdX_11318 [Ditylenchus destructor]|uniref:Uncharacterized protein n=1 Tax=Ditylenchus destructor TaxID=166010 RepID=A0AAD4N0K0_9BILA|nr:hypothetical protein DdX_11318 [Ditylenchus destructor]
MGNLNAPPRRVKRGPRQEVKLPEDCWFDVLKCLSCPIWSKMRYVSRQINGIAERNISHLPRSLIDMAIFDGNYPKPKLSRKLPKTKDTLVADGVVIPHNVIKQWFLNRFISLDTPNDIPVEEILIGRNYVKLGSMDICILGPGQLNGELGKRLFEHPFRQQKFYESVVFYGRFHPSTKFSLAYLEQFLLASFRSKLAKTRTAIIAAMLREHDSSL